MDQPGPLPGISLPQAQVDPCRQSGSRKGLWIKCTPVLLILPQFQAQAANPHPCHHSPHTSFSPLSASPLWCIYLFQCMSWQPLAHMRRLWPSCQHTSYECCHKAFFCNSSQQQNAFSAGAPFHQDQAVQVLTNNLRLC